MSKVIKPYGLTAILFLLSFWGYAQPKWTIDPFGTGKKPKEYEEKKLPSEKTGEKKFTKGRRFIQNNTTRYNYYFNAVNKLNAVVDRAKYSHKDEYGELLDFYPYSIEQTAVQKQELDSVILKATSGILLHDLRTDWVDDMYLLIGKAYYFRNEMDSAQLTFNFINYNLYKRDKDNDYADRVIGTKEGEGNVGISIADKEKLSFLQKTTGLPPTRNDALIWLIKTFTEKGEYGDAASMINILQQDKNLPKRLQNDLAEVTSYWFYIQHNYDSAAGYLEKALSNAGTKQDLGRWEFLLAQMYERTGKYDKASEYYAKAGKHTVDPEMEIYAQLNNAKMLKNGGNEAELNKTIANLLSMAKRDRYESYRDIIYYSAADLSISKPDTSNAIGFYTLSNKNNTERISYKNRSYLNLGNIAYQQQQYEDAARYYDSINIDKSVIKDSMLIAERREILGRLVTHIKAVREEDSLQRIAIMPEQERKDFVKKLLRQIRKERGMKDDDGYEGSVSSVFGSQAMQPLDLFSAGSKGEWYFYNNNLRAKGFNDFKNKWGKRSDIDNWRTKSGQDAAASAVLQSPDPSNTKPQLDSASRYTIDGMLAGLPLTQAQVDTSNNIIARNLIKEGLIFRDELNDYPQAIRVYEDYLRRFENKADAQLAEAYFGLYHSYLKLGDQAKANYYKNLVTSKFPASRFSNIITNPRLLDKSGKDPQIAAKYQDIYNQFLEGRFEGAIQAKKVADSVYGNHYWTPQLLYIESVYYIKERKDSNAIASLSALVQMNPSNGMKEKAETMIDVLKRRAEIEKYLTELKVERMQEDTMIVMESKKSTEVAKVSTPEVPVVKNQVSVIVPKAPVTDPNAGINAKLTSGTYVIEPDKPHYVAMIFENVDFVYVREAKTALERFNRNNFYKDNITVARDMLDQQKNILLFSPFADAMSALSYMSKVKKAAPVEISWLQPNKYSFIIISDKNLQVLKENKNLQQYRDLLNNNFGKNF